MPIPYLIDRIFPAGCIHIVAGPTGAGKSRWLFETMLEWEAGNQVLGHASFPQPWIYIAADRQLSEAISTIESLGIAPERIPILPAFAPLLSESNILDVVEAQGKTVLIWEGFGQYVGDRAPGTAVRRWLSTLTWMLHNGPSGPRTQPLTVIGVMEQPKMKPRDIYPNPRQRISGPAAWGHSTATVVIIEYARQDCRGPERLLGVYARNVPDLEYNATLENGHFLLRGIKPLD